MSHTPLLVKEASSSCERLPLLSSSRGVTSAITSTASTTASIALKTIIVEGTVRPRPQTPHPSRRPVAIVVLAESCPPQPLTTRATTSTALHPLFPKHLAGTKK